MVKLLFLKVGSIGRCIQQFLVVANHFHFLAFDVLQFFDFENQRASFRKASLQKQIFEGSFKTSEMLD